MRPRPVPRSPTGTLRHPKSTGGGGTPTRREKKEGGPRCGAGVVAGSWRGDHRRIVARRAQRRRGVGRRIEARHWVASYRTVDTNRTDERRDSVAGARLPTPTLRHYVKGCRHCDKHERVATGSVTTGRAPPRRGNTVRSYIGTRHPPRKKSFFTVRAQSPGSRSNDVLREQRPWRSPLTYRPRSPSLPSCIAFLRITRHVTRGGFLSYRPSDGRRVAPDRLLTTHTRDAHDPQCAGRVSCRG